jgi:YbbR domain-containing protein
MADNGSMKKTTNQSHSWKDWILENGSYKLVALFVTLILWVTILGRRDFTLSKDMDIEFLLPRAIAVAQAGDHHVTVKVSGPRMALKKFAQNPGTITVDLGRAQPGTVTAKISPRSIDVPFGVKVLSVSPETVSVTLIESSSAEEPPASAGSPSSDQQGK